VLLIGGMLSGTPYRRRETVGLEEQPDLHVEMADGVVSAPRLPGETEHPPQRCVEHDLPPTQRHSKPPSLQKSQGDSNTLKLRTFTCVAWNTHRPVVRPVGTPARGGAAGREFA
jgi:hypothetical protein